ncbi:MAG: hypothetical protein F4185_05965 [Chloroflexi bacterium]|nr:hypothetical protein [Chloroflexota bacterium]
MQGTFRRRWGRLGVGIEIALVERFVFVHGLRGLPHRGLQVAQHHVAPPDEVVATQLRQVAQRLDRFHLLRDGRRGETTAPVADHLTRESAQLRCEHGGQILAHVHLYGQEDDVRRQQPGLRAAEVEQRMALRAGLVANLERERH